MNKYERELELIAFYSDNPEEAVDANSKGTGDDFVAATKPFKYFLIAEEIDGARAIVDMTNYRVITATDNDYVEIHALAVESEAVAEKSQKIARDRRFAVDSEKHEELMIMAAKEYSTKKRVPASPLDSLFGLGWLKK